MEPDVGLEGSLSLRAEGCLCSAQAEELSAEERHTCREALKGLLGTIYQPIVIKELLILQNGSKKVSARLEYCSSVR